MSRAELAFAHLRDTGGPEAPGESPSRQWVQDEGSTYVMKLWIHATTMREIYDAYKGKTEGVFGWYKIWNRTARLFLTAKQFPTTYPSVHAYSDKEIDEFDKRMAERKNAPNLMNKREWWSPQWTLPLSATARNQERTGKVFHQFGEEPEQFRKYYGDALPSDTSEDEGWIVD